MVGLGVENDAKNRVVVRQGILQPLDKDGPDSLCAAVPVGGIVKSLAVSGPRQEKALVKTRVTVRGKDHVGAPGDRRVAISSPQRVTGKMDSRQAG